MSSHPGAAEAIDFNTHCVRGSLTVAGSPSLQQTGTGLHGDCLEVRRENDQKCSVLYYDKLYSPQMVATIYKYTIENNLTNKREKRKKETHTCEQMACT